MDIKSDVKKDVAAAESELASAEADVKKDAAVVEVELGAVFNKAVNLWKRYELYVIAFGAAVVTLFVAHWLKLIL